MSLCANGRRRAPESRAPPRMLSCARASWTIRSSGPSRCPSTETFVACPLTRTIASSQPRNRARAVSSSRWTGRSPDATRLAETEVPYRTVAIAAARVTSGSPERPR